MADLNVSLVKLLKSSLNASHKSKFLKSSSLYSFILNSMKSLIVSVSLPGTENADQSRLGYCPYYGGMLGVSCNLGRNRT